MKKTPPFQRITSVCIVLVALACLPLLARADAVSLAEEVGNLHGQAPLLWCANALLRGGEASVLPIARSEDVNPRNESP